MNGLSTLAQGIFSGFHLLGFRRGSIIIPRIQHLPEGRRITSTHYDSVHTRRKKNASNPRPQPSKYPIKSDRIASPHLFPETGPLSRVEYILPPTLLPPSQSVSLVHNQLARHLYRLSVELDLRNDAVCTEDKRGGGFSPVACGEKGWVMPQIGMLFDRLSSRGGGGFSWECVLNGAGLWLRGCFGVIVFFWSYGY